MVHKKVSVNTANHAAGIVWVEEAAVDFGVPNVAYWGSSHDCFRMIFDVAKLRCVEGIYDCQGRIQDRFIECLLPKAFAVAKQDATWELMTP